jgi:hypothetical protein
VAVGESVPQPASRPTEGGDFTPTGSGNTTTTTTTPPRRPPTTPPTEFGGGGGGIGEQAYIGAPVALSSASAGGGSTGPISIVIGQGQETFQGIQQGGGMTLALAAVALALFLRR